jgi:hypothetical protein
VQYYYTFDNNGDAIVNGSVLELMINPLQDVNKNDFPQFGMTFLQAAYLHVNYDEDTFTLWQANAIESQSLVGIGKSVIGCSANSTTATTSSQPTASATSSSQPQPQPHPAPLSSGIIAGIAVSVIAILALIAAVAFWFLARRRRRNPGLIATSDPSRYSSQTEQVKSSPVLYHKPELDGSVASVHGGQQHTNSLSFSGQPIIELPAERYD